MSKKHKQIITDTVARWRETILNTNRGDVDGAKKLLASVAKSAPVYVVDTPAQFFVAQAVIRKRVTKKYAKENLCPLYKISPDFVDEIGTGGAAPADFVIGREWARRGTKSLLERTWRQYMQQMCLTDPTIPATPALAARSLPAPSRWRRTETNVDLQNMLVYQMCAVDELYGLFHESIRQEIVFETAQKEPSAMKPPGARDWPASVENAMSALNFDTRAVLNSCMSLSSAVSSSAVDIVRGTYDFNAHAFDATQAEMLCRIMNIKDPTVTAFHEIFHLVPAVMQFRKAFLILAERPKIALNEDNQLHSEKGPAVMYRDGTGFWFVGGHMLRQAGPQIVLAPETLDGKAINALSNEEERRIAIDRVGWEKYLTDIDAKVIDSRENWIDNTVEVLFAAPSGRGEDQLKALLACRSTGRRYFLSVPRETEVAYWKRNKSRPIMNCQDVQKWMANGAKTTYLPYAAHDVRVIGAS